MIDLRLPIALVGAALFWWGGFSWHNARRFILPVLLTVSSLVLSHWDWWTLTMLSSIGIFVLGYGEKSDVHHIFGDGWGRSVWGVLAAICLSLALFLTHHLALQIGSLILGWKLWSCIFLGIYLALNFTLENALKKIPQSIGDPIIGFGFSCIIFLVR